MNFLKCLLLLVLVGACLFLESKSFSNLRHMRQLERLPETRIDVALPGEVKLRGAAMEKERAVSAPKSGERCIYVRYLRERQVRDSDGDLRWQTVEASEGAVPFLLRDETGGVDVVPSGEVDWNAALKFSIQEGSERFLEWRIDPGDEALVVGYLQRDEEAGQTEVVFDRRGDYVPLITVRTDRKERQNRGALSIVMTWGGLACLSFAVLTVFNLAGWHRLLAYLAVLAIVQAVVLFLFGCAMVASDLKAAKERWSRQEREAKTMITSLLANNGASWNGEWETLEPLLRSPLRRIPADAAERLDRVWVNVAVAGRRVTEQQSGMLDKMVSGAVGGRATFEDVPLPDRLNAAASERAMLITRAPLLSAPWFGLSPGMIGVVVAVLGIAVTTGFSWPGLRRVKLKRCVENLPTSPIRGVSFGITEITGASDTLDGEAAGYGPVSHASCLYFDYLAEEKVGSGKKEKWVTRDQETYRQDFKCHDETGALTVSTYGAEIIPRHKLVKRDGNWRFTERWIEKGDMIYALGHAEVDPGASDRLRLVKPEDDQPFIISNHHEQSLMQHMASKGMLLLNCAFSVLVLTCLFLFGLAGAFSPSDYLAASLAGPGFFFLIGGILHYNDIVFLRQRARRNWANIEVSLKKRHDLIPALESAATAIMAHERGLQEELTQLRAAYQQGTPQSPWHAGRLLEQEHHVAAHLLALREAYPELKANTNLEYLTRTLVEMENEIALKRKGYHDAAELYNQRVESFPDIVLARTFSFRQMDYLSFEPEMRKVPVVNLPEPAASQPLEQQPVVEMKFTCPHCSQKLSCPSTAAGMRIPCPTCEKELVIPKTAVTKMDAGASPHAQN